VSATLEEYRQLIADRPKKFTAEEVGFKSESENDSILNCCSCAHWFQSPARNSSVCEIYRPADDGDVPSLGVCMFHTIDGKHFPLLEK